MFQKISSNDTEKIEALLEDALELKISGIIKLKEDDDNALINSAVGYTSALTEYLIDYTNDSPVVKAQEKQEKINILNGMHFDADDDDDKKIEDMKHYIQNLGITDKALMYQSVMMSENLRKAGYKKKKQKLLSMRLLFMTAIHFTQTVRINPAC